MSHNIDNIIKGYFPISNGLINGNKRGNLGNPGINEKTIRDFVLANGNLWPVRTE